MVNPITLTSGIDSQAARGISRDVPQRSHVSGTSESPITSTIDPAVQISDRIKAAKQAAEEHTGLVNDSLTRLTNGGGRFRQGVQVAATTTHFSGAETHGVTDPGQDLGTSGGPIQLVGRVLDQMASLGGAAVQSQAGHLLGM